MSRLRYFIVKSYTIILDRAPLTKLISDPNPQHWIKFNIEFGMRTFYHAKNRSTVLTSTMIHFELFTSFYYNKTTKCCFL